MHKIFHLVVELAVHAKQAAQSAIELHKQKEFDFKIGMNSILSM